MAEWPNVIVTGRVPTLFDVIRKVNVPPKVTVQWLEANGFKSKNDRPLLGLLKGLAYLDTSGTPTEKWSELRGTDADRKASIGRQMQVAYPQVFQNFPIAHVRDSLTKDELRAFIRPKVTFGEPSVNAVTDTFMALRALATFDVAGAPIPPETTVKVTVPTSNPAAAPAAGAAPAASSGSVKHRHPSRSGAARYDRLGCLRQAV